MTAIVPSFVFWRPCIVAKVEIPCIGLIDRYPTTSVAARNKNPTADNQQGHNSQGKPRKEFFPSNQNQGGQTEKEKKDSFDRYVEELQRKQEEEQKAQVRENIMKAIGRNEEAQKARERREKEKKEEKEREDRDKDDFERDYWGR